MEKKGVLAEFKQFLLRGNVVDLAVAVVIGTAFGAVVKALVSDILTPLIGIPGKADFSTLKFTIHGSHFLYGDLINNVISFLSVAAAVFFFVVKPVNSLTSRLKRSAPEAKKTKDCPYCLTPIPLAATKCPACTSVVDAVPAT